MIQVVLFQYLAARGDVVKEMEESWVISKEVGGDKDEKDHGGGLLGGLERHLSTARVRRRLVDFLTFVRLDLSTCFEMDFLKAVELNFFVRVMNSAAQLPMLNLTLNRLQTNHP